MSTSNGRSKELSIVDICYHVIISEIIFGSTVFIK